MRRICVFALLALLASSLSAQQASIQARPTSLTIPPGQRAAALTIENIGTQEASVQVEIMAWAPDGENEKLTPTSAVLVSPPMVLVPPQQRRVVRIMPPAPTSANQDTLYRVIVTQLPSESAAPSGSISLLMRYQIPLHVRSAKPTAGVLACRIEASDLVCVNPSGRARQIAGLYVGGAVQTPGLLGYVLPSATRRWPGIFASAPDPNSVLSARIDGADPVVISDP